MSPFPLTDPVHPIPSPKALSDAYLPTLPTPPLPVPHGTLEVALVTGANALTVALAIPHPLLPEDFDSLNNSHVTFQVCDCIQEFFGHSFHPDVPDHIPCLTWLCSATTVVTAIHNSLCQSVSHVDPADKPYTTP